MSISESRFRQILREEARRVVREGDSTLREGLFDQLSNTVGAAFGANNPQTATERFKKNVPDFMAAYDMYKKLKQKYTGFSKRGIEPFGGFTPETVEIAINAMERISRRESNLKQFYKDVDAVIGPRRNWQDLQSALNVAKNFMSDSNPNRAIAETYFDTSAHFGREMDAHDRRRDAERARERDLDRRGGGDGGGSSDEPDRPGRMHGVGGRHTGPLDADALGTLIGA
jgi:hypothetical protein